MMMSNLTVSGIGFKFFHLIASARRFFLSLRIWFFTSCPSSCLLPPFRLKLLCCRGFCLWCERYQSDKCCELKLHPHLIILCLTAVTVTHGFSVLFSCFRRAGSSSALRVPYPISPTSSHVYPVNPVSPHHISGKPGGPSPLQ